MSPAGGSMEQQIDAKTLDEASAWELHLAFLKRLGVDVMTATTSSIISGPEGGAVTVTGIARDEDGKNILDGDGDNRHFRTYTDQYQFTRGQP